MSTTILEREVKLRFSSADEAREAVIAAGAMPLYGRRLRKMRSSILKTNNSPPTMRPGEWRTENQLT